MQKSNAFDDLENLDFGGDSNDQKVSPIMKDSEKRTDTDNGLFVDPDAFGNDSDEDEDEEEEGDAPEVGIDSASKPEDQDIFNTSEQNESPEKMEEQVEAEEEEEKPTTAQPQAMTLAAPGAEGEEELDEEAQKKMVEEQFMMIYNNDQQLREMLQDNVEQFTLEEKYQIL